MLRAPVSYVSGALMRVNKSTLVALIHVPRGSWGLNLLSLHCLGRQDDDVEAARCLSTDGD